MRRRLVATVLSAAISACSLGGDNPQAYTLYRNSPVGEMRIHMATFDAEEGEAYNQENCQIAADLFRSQPGVSVRYWCEKGAYKK